MQRIKNLNLYQRIILGLLAVMLIVFTVAYSVVTSRVGYLYKDAILVPREEIDGISYTGRVNGIDTMIMVDADTAVTFACGDKVYGPYTVKDDPAAVPKDSDFAELMRGVEILEGETLLFRGGALETDMGSAFDIVFFEEDGSLVSYDITYSTGNGIEYDMDGNPIDKMKPSLVDVLELTGEPELTNKGEWGMWFCGLFVSAFTAVLILFADELFRWNLSFQIRDAERAEPSEWEMFSRYSSWTVLPIVALIAYIVGLQ